MVVILGAVWGGFITLLARAARSDRQGDDAGA